MSFEQRTFRRQGQRYCLRLEPEVWFWLEEIAALRNRGLVELVSEIARERAKGQSLCSALRCFAVRFYRRHAI